MIMQYPRLSGHAAVFRSVTGLSVSEFDALLKEVAPRVAAAEYARLSRPNRQRAIGGGRPFTLTTRDQVLLTVIWLRLYPTDQVLGYLFGVSDDTARRTVHRVVPMLEVLGRDRMRLPDPGRGRRRQLDALLAATPGLAVVIDSFEQPIQRPTDRTEADGYYSGKKKRHTLKTQVAVDEETGAFVDVSESVRGPTADITLAKDTGLLGRLPPGVGVIGDSAYQGIADEHPTKLGATPRKKPRGRPRPEEDIAYNTAFARRRVIVEHTIGRLRRYQAVTQVDRHHRRGHTTRVVAAAGLVNHALAARAVASARQRPRSRPVVVLPPSHAADDRTLLAA